MGDVIAMWLCVADVFSHCGRCTFSHTPDEAMSGGLAKACDLRKNQLC